MLELIAFSAIACLSLTGAASIAEEGKTHFESFDYTGKDLLHSPWPFLRGEVAYAVCEGSQEDKKCKAYVRSVDRGEEIVRSCDLNLKYKDAYYHSHAPFNLVNSRMVFVVRVGDTEMKLVNVHLKGCRVKETTVDLPKDPTENRVSWYFTKVFVVPRESNYELFFPNEVLCPGSLCRAVYDYDGQLVKAATAFPVKVSEMKMYRIDSAINGTYLVAQSVGYDTSNVHLVRDEDGKTSTHKMFTDALDVPYVGLSTEGSKIGYCAHLEKNIVCEQYDGEGKTKIIQAEIQYVRERGYPYIDMYNLEEGFLLLTVEFYPSFHDKNSRATVSVSHFDGQGKQGKSVNVDLQCVDLKLVLGKLYKNSNGQICVNAICMAPFNGYNNINRSKFSWTSKCFLENELF